MWSGTNNPDQYWILIVSSLLTMNSPTTHSRSYMLDTQSYDDAEVSNACPFVIRVLRKWWWEVSFSIPRRRGHALRALAWRRFILESRTPSSIKGWNLLAASRYFAGPSWLCYARACLFFIKTLSAEIRRCNSSSLGFGLVSKTAIICLRS